MSFFEKIFGGGISITEMQDRADRKTAAKKLYDAMCSGDLSAAKAALATQVGHRFLGINPNVRGEHGLTVFHIASIIGATDIMEELYKKPIEKLLKDANTENKETEDMMHAKDNLGYTALHHAIMQKDSYDTIQWLIEKGTDINAINKQGYTPLDILQALMPTHFSASDDLRIKKNLLEQHGAKTKQQVVVDDFQFPQFPEIKKLEWHAFRPHNLSRFASTDSMPLTAATDGKYNPQAYSALPEADFGASSSFGNLRKSEGSYSLRKLGQDLNQEDALKDVDFSDNESASTNVTGVTGGTEGFQVIQQDNYIPSALSSRADTEEWGSSVPPSPTGDQAIFSTPVHPSPGFLVSPHTPNASSNRLGSSGPQLFQSPRTPIAQNINKDLSGLSNTSDRSSCYGPETPHDGFASSKPPFRVN